jgi:drug/metabolite transporter (DMT)-like permease
LGETRQLTPDHFTAGAAFAFFYLLIVSSLVGFVAFNWLLGHVSAPQVGTYAYVNPVVAVLVGTLLDDEELTGWILGGILVILGGVALVRNSGRRAKPQTAPGPLRVQTVPQLSSLAQDGAASGEPGMHKEMTLR